nr:30S ribosomal protein S5 [Mycoplasmoides fastidiosum]
MVAWKRVSKTTKGGRQGRIWTLVVVGNKKGSIGYGIGKAEEFPDAMKKAVKNALKNVVKVKINANGTVYHENIGKHCASRVLIKPAKIGIGIIAGGPIKTVLELAGYTDIYSKNLGSSSSMNMVQATIKALLKQHTPAEIAKLRDKRIEEL